MDLQYVNLSELAVDEYGRVVLTGEFLDYLDSSSHVVSAGANSLSCQGSGNGNCINSGLCQNTTNSVSCTNPTTCGGSSNTRCTRATK